MELTSRKATPATLSTIELSELISTVGVKVRITEDQSVDPGMLLIEQEAVWPYPAETLLCKRLDQGVTLYDLIKVIDALGFPIEYEELK